MTLPCLSSVLQVLLSPACSVTTGQKILQIPLKSNQQVQDKVYQFQLCKDISICKIVLGEEQLPLLYSVVSQSASGLVGKMGFLVPICTPTTDNQPKLWPFALSSRIYKLVKVYFYIIKPSLHISLNPLPQTLCPGNV